MTFQIFKLRVLAIALCMMATVSINAQETAQMQALIGQSLSKVNPSKPETMLNNIAELKRIDAMFPDSILPKYQMALQSLNFSVMTINKMELMKGADLSDVCTLRGFLYMVRIVQDPAQNGQRYYMDVMQNYEKALRINPDNQFAKQLQQKFVEGMKQAGK